MIATLTERFQRWVWRPTASDAPWWRRSGIGVLRVATALVRDLAEGQLNLRAMSLVYTTILSLVPLLAISFSILKGLGVHNSAEPLLLSLLEPLGPRGVEVTGQIMGFINNIKVGVLGSVGLGFLIFTVISLMQKIERAFNFTWRVTRERSFAKRFSDYLSVIAVGPVLVFSALALKASVMSNDLLLAFPLTRVLGQVVGTLIPYVLIVGAFAFIYVFVPNTKVHWRSAFYGALVSGLLWETVGWIFAAYVVSSTQYSAIYSAFATVIILMIWLYLGWLILLIGAAVAFYHQHPHYARTSGQDFSLSHRDMLRVAFEIMGLIGKSHYEGAPPWTTTRIARHLALPEAALHDAMSALEQHGLLARAAGEDGSYLPARPFETTPVKSILDALNSSGPEGIANRPRNTAVDTLLHAADDAISRVLHDITLKDLASGKPLFDEQSHLQKRRP